MRDFVVISLMCVLLLAGCKKTPDHVIPKSNMVDLMADMYKAEAILEENESTFYNDSLKMTVRQSVMKKHNVTQEQLDTSLVWYSHNLDVYNDVYKDIVKVLDEEYNELSKEDFTSVQTELNSDMKPSVPRYRMVGDTADIWGRSRTWIFLPGFKHNIITFDMKPDKECMQGDKYDLAFKLVNNKSTLKIYVGVDYKDGSTSFIYRTSTLRDGWSHVTLQSDSLREVKRLYGYVTSQSTQNHVAYMDSVELIRTHLDRNSYEHMMKQTKWIGENDKKVSNDNDNNTDELSESIDKTPSPHTRRFEALKKLEAKDKSN